MPTAGQQRFLVVEGLDGTGTTTVASLVAESLQRRDLQVHLTAEPTGGPFGRLLRQHLRGELDLGAHAAALAFCADRAEHLDSLVRPALRRGHWVVSDRYILSTLAYQGAEGVDRAAILAASEGIEAPGLTVVLDVPDEVRTERMSARGTRDRYEDPQLAQRLRASYAASVELLRSAGHRIEVLDATPAAPDVAAAVLAQLDAGVPDALEPPQT